MKLYLKALFGACAAAAVLGSGVSFTLPNGMQAGLVSTHAATYKTMSDDNNGGVIITKCTLDEGETSIEVPEKIELTVSGIELTVSGIAERAFQNQAALKSVKLPETITSIGASAFAGCSGLTSINIPGGVKTTGRLMFNNCTNLTNVDISEGLTSLTEYSFRGCFRFKMHYFEPEWCDYRLLYICFG